MPDSTATNPKGKAYKPRAGIVRKSKAERDAHAKEEAEKAAARAAAAAQAAGKPTQQPKSIASKKREAARDNRDSSQSAAGGVFGAGAGTRQGWRKSAVDEGFSEMLEGQEGIKPSDGPTLQGQGSSSGGQRGRTGGGGSNSVAEGRKISEQTPDGMVIESDDDKDDEDEIVQKRHNIESIVISSSEEDNDDDVVTGKRKARAPSEVKKSKSIGGLRPVRAPRNKAEEQTEEDEWKEGRKSFKPSRIVGEDADDQDEVEEMDVDDEQTNLHPVKPDIPSSPEIPKRGKPGRKGGVKTKDGKLATETFEERAERLRLNKDIEKLRDEFILSPKIKKDVGTDPDDDNERPNGKLFLFQFPPLVPFLVDQESALQMGSDGRQYISDDAPNIKNDPDAPAVSNTDSAGNPSNLVASIPKTQMEGVFTANEPTRLPSGRVGKLQIHKSGKVTLDWGGTNMEIRYGTEVNFLQDAVLVETPKPRDEDEEKQSDSQIGKTYALGQIQQKMIVIPDWQKLHD